MTTNTITNIPLLLCFQNEGAINQPYTTVDVVYMSTATARCSHNTQSAMSYDLVFVVNKCIFSR